MSRLSDDGPGAGPPAVSAPAEAQPSSRRRRVGNDRDHAAHRLIGIVLLVPPVLVIVHGLKERPVAK